MYTHRLLESLRVQLKQKQTSSPPMMSDCAASACLGTQVVCTRKLDADSLHLFLDILPTPQPTSLVPSSLARRPCRRPGAGWPCARPGRLTCGSTSQTCPPTCAPRDEDHLQLQSSSFAQRARNVHVAGRRHNVHTLHAANFQLKILLYASCTTHSRLVMASEYGTALPCKPTMAGTCAFKPPCGGTQICLTLMQYLHTPALYTHSVEESTSNK